MKIKWFFLVLLLPFVNTYAGLIQENVTTSAFNSTINGVSFQHDAILTYNGYQYAVYWSDGPHVGVARKQLPDGTWQTLELTDYQFTGDDPHYDISSRAWAILIR